MTEKKIIGLEQFMPMDVVSDAILELIHGGSVNRDEIALRMADYNKGNNRSKKAVNTIVASVTAKNALTKALRKEFDVVSYAKLSKCDRSMIAVCLISLRYPFLYDLLVAFAKLFNLQDTVNHQYIQSTIAAKYGSNLTLNHGLEAGIRIAIDSGLITRVKAGLFAKGELVNVSQFAKEAWIYTDFELNGRKKLLTEELRFQPWSSYLPDFEIDWEKSQILEARFDFGDQIWIEKAKSR